MIDQGAGLWLAAHRYLANSQGTKDGIRQAIEAGMPTLLMDSEEGRPVRIGGDERSG